MESKSCEVCGDNFYRPPSYSRKQWELKRGCSRKCGSKLTAATMTGRKRSPEFRKARSEAMKKSWADPNFRRERSRLLKDTITPERRKNMSESRKRYLRENPDVLKKQVDRFSEWSKTHSKETSQRLKREWKEGKRDHVIKPMLEGLKRSWKENREEKLEALKAAQTPEAIRRRAAKITAEKHVDWKGNDASYSSKHKWVRKHWKKTGACELCNSRPEPRGRLRVGTQWANLDGEYNREDRSTWKELCPPCHKKLDKGIITL